MNAAADIRAAHETWQRKTAELRIVLMTWGHRELTEVVTDALDTKESLIDHIIENDLLCDEVDDIIADYKRDRGIEESTEPIRLCAGASTPEEERAAYKRAMAGDSP